MPGAVQDLILDRIRALPPPARDLAQLVAVVPTRADAALVADAAEQVDVCIAAGVLVPAGDGVSYRHELLRSAVEDSLSPVRRAELHRRVLRALADRAGRRSRAAGPPRPAGGRPRGRAALRPDRGPARPPARAPIGRRPGTTGRPPRTPTGFPTPEQRRAARAVRRRGAPDRRERGGAAGARQSARRPGAAGSGRAIAENLRWISQLAWWTGRVDRMREAADRALEVLAGLPPSQALAMAYVAQAQLRYRVNDLAGSAAWAERAVDLAEELGEDEIALHAAVTRDTARLAAGDLGRLDVAGGDPRGRPGGRSGRSGGPGAGQPGHRGRRRAGPVHRGRGADRAVARLQRGAQPRRALPAHPVRRGPGSGWSAATGTAR